MPVGQRFCTFPLWFYSSVYVFSHIYAQGRLKCLVRSGRGANRSVGELSQQIWLSCSSFTAAREKKNVLQHSNKANFTLLRNQFWREWRVYFFQEPPSFPLSHTHWRSLTSAVCVWARQYTRRVRFILCCRTAGALWVSLPSSLILFTFSALVADSRLADGAISFTSSLEKTNVASLWKYFKNAQQSSFVSYYGILTFLEF